MALNLMMDATAMYPEAYHPSHPEKRRDMRGYARHFTRTQRPPKYYFIDFGISCRFDPSNGPPLEVPIRGGDKTVPELQDCSYEPRDPFPTDIYFLGNAFREHFTATNHGFEFLEQFVSEMIQTDPSKRPTADELVSRFEIIRKGLSSWKLRSRVIPKHSDIVDHLIRAPAHWARRIGFVAKGVAPLPLS
ncbi:hypothetical protein BJ138DRAFT_1100748 [Hygrophoropsis aurantiaca]|uniref:Uncharacterized protein n=1 Tax=Hygrophoropsis aurantiaca TaxID=72124 RepID=A0ACB8AEL4_9AGAM|nr:hypothetical protein BJ138DRAFT_1100748 [Hygrophoropsis aurantiaca]